MPKFRIVKADSKGKTTSEETVEAFNMVEATRIALDQENISIIEVEGGEQNG